MGLSERDDEDIRTALDYLCGWTGVRHTEDQRISKARDLLNSILERNMDEPVPLVPDPRWVDSIGHDSYIESYANAIINALWVALAIIVLLAVVFAIF